MRKLPRSLSVVGLSALALVVAPVVASAQVTLGQLAPGTTSSPYCVNSPYDLVPGTVAAGNGYAAPSAGVITSWSTYAAEGAGQQLSFKVFRPYGPGKFTVVAKDGPRSLAPGVVNTFKVSIPVTAGDLIGDQDANADDVPNACLFETGNSADITLEEEGDVAPGSQFSTFENPGALPNVTATLLPPPAIGSISPAAGSVKGGTGVVIAGVNFAELRGVSFGSTPAASYAVNSESQITAVAPASASLGSAPITITTVAGTASSTTAFVYEGCKVPKLKGKKLKASKKKARKSDCKIGKVKKLGDATAKTGKIKKQNPKPGKILAPGTKINVKLSN